MDPGAFVPPADDDTPDGNSDVIGPEFVVHDNPFPEADEGNRPGDEDDSFSEGECDEADQWPVNHHLTSRCQAILSELMAIDSAFKFFALFPGHYEVDHTPMCLGDVHVKLHNYEYYSTEDFAQDIRQVLDDARSFTELPPYLHETASRLEVELDLKIAALPHCLTEVEERSDLQRFVELRFALYRTAKGSLPV